MDINQIFRDAVEKEASDIFIVAGLSISFKTHGVIWPQGEQRLRADETETIIKQVYTAAGRSMQKFLEEGDDDFSFALEGAGRFRINTYKQRGSYAMVGRVVRFTL
ncbi:MAG: type IV pili twitching motility protein PilT, partial [Niameybacter sp.]